MSVRPVVPLQDHFDSFLSRADEAEASLEAFLVPDFRQKNKVRLSV